MLHKGLCGMRKRNLRKKTPNTKLFALTLVKGCLGAEACRDSRQVKATHTSNLGPLWSGWSGLAIIIRVIGSSFLTSSKNPLWDHMTLTLLVGFEWPFSPFLNFSYQ